MSLPPFVAIAGPTGVGKSRLAIALAQRSGGEVVNYDSVQVYRGFDIGSAKTTSNERQGVPHHLLDIVEATDDFTAADFARLATQTVSGLQSRDILPVLAGGTFFYLRALTHGLPELPPADESIRLRLKRIAASPRGALRLARLLERVDPISNARIAAADQHRRERALEVYLLTGRPISSWERPTATMPPRRPYLLVALELERSVLSHRLDQRVREMYEQGLIEETASLLSRYPAAARPFGAIGYAEAVRHVRGEITRDEAIAETQRRTRAYAKRQRTWLRSEPFALWLSAESALEAMVDTILDTLRRRTKQS